MPIRAIPYITVFLFNGSENGQTSFDVLPDWIDQWHHLATTYNGSEIILYVDGEQVNAGTFSGAIPTSGQDIMLGRGPTSGYFAGTMDEVRIWNVVRTQEEIVAAMNKEIPPNSTGLVGYYRMNEGTTDGDNTAITTITDLASSPRNGTLNNFARTGSTSNFTTGYLELIALPLKNASFTATKKEASIELRWMQGASDMPSMFEVERSTDGISFTKIGSISGKASRTETSLVFTDIKPKAGNNYYRLKVIEADSRIAYSSIIAVKVKGTRAGLHIYPVPARNTLQLEIIEPEGPVNINIRNLAGATIINVKAASTGGTLFTAIDISTLPKGTYVAQVNKKSSVFIKQ
jgi:hypothetical protein